MNIRSSIVIFLIAITCGIPALAATSNWSDVKGGAVRLVSADAFDGETYTAGLEFLLEPGWHTYWRFPGEAGIAPDLDFERSENLASADVLYPVPVRYDDGFSTSIVYHDGVVLPLRITPSDPGAPVRLHLDVEFGVCKDVCVPGDASLELTLMPDREADRLMAKIIDRDEKRVPRAASEEAPRIDSIRVTAGSGKPVLEITAELAGGQTGTTDLFLEGPPGSFHGVPVLANRTDTAAVWHLPVRGLKTLPGTTPIRVLLVDGDRAVESMHNIESSDLSP